MRAKSSCKAKTKKTPRAANFTDLEEDHTHAEEHILLCTIMCSSNRIYTFNKLPIQSLTNFKITNINIQGVYKFLIVFIISKNIIKHFSSDL